MKNCCYCGSLSMFGKSLKTGRFICKDCLKLVPNLIRPSALASLDTFSEAVEYHKKYKKEDFKCTNSYGFLFLDELHGLFNIGDAVFNLMDLQNVSFSCQNARVKSPTNVTADIVFSCEIKYPSDKKIIVSISKIIKFETKCSVIEKDERAISWTSPEEMQIFQNMFYQAYHYAFERYKFQTEKDAIHNFIHKSKFDELELAKNLFMITDDNFTKEIVRTRRNLLLKAFHPDNIGDENATKRINDAYQILIKNLPNV